MAREWFINVAECRNFNERKTIFSKLISARVYSYISFTNIGFIPEKIQHKECSDKQYFIPKAVDSCIYFFIKLIQKLNLNQPILKKCPEKLFPWLSSIFSSWSIFFVKKSVCQPRRFFIFAKHSLRRFAPQKNLKIQMFHGVYLLNFHHFRTNSSFIRFH